MLPAEEWNTRLLVSLEHLITRLKVTEADICTLVQFKSLLTDLGLVS